VEDFSVSGVVSLQLLCPESWCIILHRHGTEYTLTSQVAGPVLGAEGQSFNINMA
jgi:hypothetical protein